MMTATWKTMAGLGFSSYEACTDGSIRSVDRQAGNRRLKGQVLSTRVSNRGYVLIDLTQDDGRRVTRTVHSVILGTFAGPCPRGMEARHLDDDPLNNRWAPGDEEQSRAAGGNLIWGTKLENAADKWRNGNRAAPVAVPKACVRCGGPFAGNGRRCHECVVWIGVKAGELLSGGTTLGSACEQLEYPSAEGLHTLAVKYGDYGVVKRSWLRRVTVALRDFFDADHDA